jgi:hypothetical protein
MTEQSRNDAQVHSQAKISSASAITVEPVSAPTNVQNL